MHIEFTFSNVHIKFKKKFISKYECLLYDLDVNFVRVSDCEVVNKFNLIKNALFKQSKNPPATKFRPVLMRVV